MGRLIPDRFILALLTAVALASVLPARGMSAAAVSVLATAMIVLLFFLHGLRLSREAVVAGMLNWRLHLTILAITFAAFPLLGLGLSLALPRALTPPLWLGILFLCALPSTVQSSIAFTSIAGGNVPAAVTSATASNVLGILLTPLLVNLIAGVRGGAAPLSGIGTVVLELLVPFVAGQLARRWLATWGQRHRKLLSTTDRATILVAVYSAFSAAVIAGLWHRTSVIVLVTVLALCGVLLAIVLAGTWYGARLLGFDRADAIAIQFCGSKKTLASGVPMARVLFAGPSLGTVLLPLMIFHQIQLMACAWLAARYARNRGDQRSAAEVPIAADID
ncbi:MAG: bile acid:sodium symporter [Novosphingobium sp.]|nr:bile acid:sodium symporter [Novosphingobium sp.]